MTKRRKQLRDAWKELIRARSFVLAVHQRPDGDALGSALAIARVLKNAGKYVDVVSEDGVPDDCAFIPESETVVTSAGMCYEVGMLVDCEGVKRVGSAKDAILSSHITACIDHHVPNGEFGKIRVVDPDASSTAELVTELFEANHIQIDQVLATQLMAGLVSDTGAFRFANTTPMTFQIASRLTEAGARPSEIARATYESRSLNSMKLLGRALDSLELDPTGRVVWATVTQKDMKEIGATDADTEGIVNLVRWVSGPDVAILFRESEPKSIRISLRSGNGVNVDRIARVFGGGGHEAAAGCTVEAPLDEASKMVIKEVLKWTVS